MTQMQIRAGIVARVADAIERAGGCQVVAVAMQTDYRHVWSWSVGTNLPNALSLVQLCAVLKVSADWLLLGEKRA